MVEDCRAVTVRLVVFCLVLEELGGGDGEVTDGRVWVASDRREDLTKTEQTLELDVFNDNIRNGGVVEEEVVKRVNSSVLDGLRKIADDELGGARVVPEGILDTFQEFIGIEP